MTIVWMDGNGMDTLLTNACSVDQLAVLQIIDIAIDIPEEERHIIMPVVLQALRNH